MPFVLPMSPNKIDNLLSMIMINFSIKLPCDNYVLNYVGRKLLESTLSNLVSQGREEDPRCVQNFCVVHT